MQHNKKEILSVLKKKEIVTVATFSGDKIRTRTMHFAVDDRFNIYLASKKGDPKTIQILHHPSVSLLIYNPRKSITESQEVEITGKTILVKEEKEREKNFKILAKKSPVVKYFVNTNNTQILEVIKVIPQTVKFRVFKEITQGIPPTVLEFPENISVSKDWERLKRKIKAWYIALRIPFLTATAVPVLLGTAIAWSRRGIFHAGYFVLTLTGALFLHLGTNLANDYFDHRSRNDELNKEFVRPFSGGSRVIQLGFLTPLEVLMGGIAFFFFGSLIGIYLTLMRGLPVLIMGLVGIISGFFYSCPPFKWANRGIGEILVGINFGILMTLGTYFVQVQEIIIEPILASLPVAIFITAVLLINGFPDYIADKAVKKKTLVVRLGREKAVTLFMVIVGSAYIIIPLAVIFKFLPPTVLLVFLSLPLVWKSIVILKKFHSDSFNLAPANAMTILSHLTISFLLILAYLSLRLKMEHPDYLIIISLFFAAIVFWMYKYIEKQKQIFQGLQKSIG